MRFASLTSCAAVKSFTLPMSFRSSSSGSRCPCVSVRSMLTRPFSRKTRAFGDGGGNDEHGAHERVASTPGCGLTLAAISCAGSAPVEPERSGQKESPASRTLFASVPHLARTGGASMPLGLSRRSGTQGQYHHPTPYQTILRSFVRRLRVAGVSGLEEVGVGAGDQLLKTFGGLSLGQAERDRMLGIGSREYRGNPLETSPRVGPAEVRHRT
jgi:hypothetical protein